MEAIAAAGRLLGTNEVVVDMKITATLPGKIERVTTRIGSVPMICPRHGTTACLTEATGVCFHDLIATYPDGMDQAHVALHFGVDHTRIQQIESMALRKLARAVKRRGLDLARVVADRFGVPQRRYGAAL